MIKDEQIEEVRSRADVVQVIGERVPLKKAGHNFKGLCPFHQEKTPSFMVHPEKQIFHCFGCGEGGDVFTFLMKYEGIEFTEAIERLADRYGVTITPVGGDATGIARQKGEKDLLYRLNKLAVRFFHDALQSAAGSKGRDYLERRGIRPEMIREHYLGYAPADGRGLIQKLREKKAPLELAEKLGLIRKGTSGDYYDFFRDRFLFTVVSPEGKILGFSGRALEEEAQPKYLNSSESPIYHKSETLLGLHVARSAIREQDTVVLVEGNFDMLRLHQEGLKHVVAPLGTALTERQVRYLRRFTDNFILLFDGDTAGVRAAERALDIFLPLGMVPRVVLLPSGEDPDSFVKKNGIEPLRTMISMSASLLETRIEHILKEAKDTQGRVKAVKGIAELLAKLPGEIEKGLYIQRVAGRFGLSEEALLATLAPKKRSFRNESNFSAVSGDHEAKKFPPIERTILEVLLSGYASPGILLKEIEAIDFSSQALGRIWGLVKEAFARDGQVDLAKILGFSQEQEGEDVRRLLTELAMAGGRWKDEGEKVAEDCLRKLRMTRFQDRLKQLSLEIRQAETEHDDDRLDELKKQKRILTNEIRSLH